jgi:nucleotide-binding universal stress UspA family protein
MIKTVLCAIDIAEHEQDLKVLNVAAEMAKAHKAQLDLVSVVPDYGLSSVGSFFDKGHHEAAVVEAKERLNEVAEAALGKAANSKVRHIVATGKAYDQILKTAKASKTDLIVIGAHAPDLEDFLLGPNASRVVRHSTCSVYVVR